MQTSVLYIMYDSSSHEQTGGVITFAHFGERDLVEKMECIKDE